MDIRSPSSVSQGNTPSAPRAPAARVAGARCYPPLAAALAVLGVGLAWSFFGGWRLREVALNADLTRFEKMAERLQVEAERRAQTFVYGLHAVRGALNTSEHVSEGAFRDLIVSLDPARHYPGSLGFSFVARVPSRRSSAHARNVFGRTAGDGDLYVTLLEEPTSGELGVDIAADPVQREAADRAMLSGEPALSGPTGPNRTCVYFMPVYAAGTNPETEEERRRELVGWVRAPFSVAQTLASSTGLSAGLLDLEVYDGRSTERAQLLYDQDGVPHAVPDAPAGDTETDRAFWRRRTLRIGGRDWTVWVGATPAFDELRHGLTPAVATAAGAVISSLLAFVVWAMGTARARAVSLAADMTRELRGSERRFRAIADASPAMMWTSGEDGSCTYTNSEWRDFTGAAMAECLGPGWSSFIHADDQDRATNAFVRGVRDRCPFDLELRLRRHDGMYRWCRFHAAPNLGDDGGFHGLVAVVFDFHDEHEAEQVRRRQMQVQDEMSAVARVGGWEFYPATGEAAWTAQMYEIFEVPRTYSPQLATSLASFGDGAAMVASLLERATETGEGFDYTLPFTTAKGNKLWVRGRGKAERRPDGTVRLYGALQDVTESQAATKALVDERLRLQVFVEHAPAAIAMLDNEMRYIAVSRRWIADYALEGREIIGCCHYDVFPNTPDLWREAHRRCLAGAVEMRADDVWTPDGWDHDQHLRWEVRPWMQADGSIGGVMMCTADITVEKQREEELARLCRAAEAASRAKSEFLANMSHEIRTPLTAIMGYADLLRDDSDTARAPDRRLETIDTIRSAGQHLMSVINNILDLSKIEADRMTFTLSDTGLTGILSEVEALVRPRAAEKGISIALRLTTPVPERIVSEPTFLRQILTNLVANAVKFTENGGVTVHAGVVQGASGPCLRVDVEDTGPGLTPEQAGKLFQPFTQADSGMSRKFGGTGLGLTISRRLAVLLGGDVMLHHSRPGVGSTFRFELPLQAATGSPVVASIGQPEKPAAAPAQAGRLKGRVLLAEDGPDNQRLITLHLTKAGAQVDVAENGLVALSMIEAAAVAGRPYDLLVSDMQMPEMDGYTLARTLRQRGSMLPILALTAHAMAEDREKCIAAGCDDYDSKPINKARLIERCCRWIAAQHPAKTAA